MKRKMILCRFLALIVAGAWFSSAAYAQVDNHGNDFLLTFIENVAPYEVQLHLTGEVDTTVDIEYPVGTLFATENVVAGTVTVVNLPIEITTSSNALRLHSTNEFVVYMLNIRDYSSDASLALPVDALGTDYISVGYIPLRASYPGLIAIAATQDGTMVDIDGTTVNIDRGDVHRISTGAQDPSGMRITSNFPVAVTSGNQCSNIPPGVTACDTLFQMLTPVSGWGRTVPVAPLPVSNRPNGAIYRIYAAEDGSVIRQDGVDITTLNANEFVEIPQLTAAHVFSSDNPIYVMQYMTGQNDSGASNGDPFMVNIPPAGQYLNFYTFSTVEGNFTEHYLNIIANNADIGSLTLDSSVVTGFTAISGTDLSYVTLSLSVGVHQTSSANPHGIVVLGLGDYNSYGYAGGQSFNPINTFYTLTIEPPTNGTVTSNGSIDCGSTCEEVVQFGLVTLTATPDSGYSFVGWGGDCSGTDNPLEFTIATDMTCSATFETSNTTHTLTVTTPSNGTVTSNGAINCGNTCTEELSSGSPVTLTAVPDSGYLFVGWGGDCSGTDNPLNFTLTADMTCSASFGTSSTTHTLTVTTPSNGTVTSNGAIDCGNTCTEELLSGSPVTLTPIPDSGYQFVSWGGDCSGTNNPLNFNLTADMTCSASFGITTLVTLLDLTATASYGAVTIAWKTGFEFDNAGFVVWRGQLNADKTECSLNGEDYTEVKQISPFIWAQGEAASYSYQDTQVESGNTYCYALEDVDFYGTSTYHLNNIASATVQ